MTIYVERVQLVPRWRRMWDAVLVLLFVNAIWFELGGNITSLDFEDFFFLAFQAWLFFEMRLSKDLRIELTREVLRLRVGFLRRQLKLSQIIEVIPHAVGPIRPTLLSWNPDTSLYVSRIVRSQIQICYPTDRSLYFSCADPEQLSVTIRQAVQFASRELVRS